MNNNYFIIGGVAFGVIVVVFISIVAFLLLCGIIVAIVVPLSIRAKNKKYNEFVTANSPRLKEIEEINKSYKFNKYRTIYNITRETDNRRMFYKTEPVDIFVKYLRDNHLAWVDTQKKIAQNRDLLDKYNLQMETINTHIPKDICVKSNMDYYKCYQTEMELCEKKKLKPSTGISFRVDFNYHSKQYRNTDRKYKEFGYLEFVRALESVSSYRMDRKTYEQYVAAERALLTDSMRYDVMRRDGFKCVLCGATAADGAKLHVDHIYPVSRGGRTVMSNLRTLCERCNMGKSNKIE